MLSVSSASWVDFTELISPLVFLMRKHRTKSEQWAGGAAAHCAFTSGRLPHKRLRGGKLKDGALAHMLAFSPSFLSLLFRDVNGSFEPLWSRLCIKGHIETLHTVCDGCHCSESVLVPELCLCIQTDDRERILLLIILGIIFFYLDHNVFGLDCTLQFGSLSRE